MRFGGKGQKNLVSLSKYVQNKRTTNLTKIDLRRTSLVPSSYLPRTWFGH